jgi:hypothetical protein
MISPGVNLDLNQTFKKIDDRNNKAAMAIHSLIMPALQKITDGKNKNEKIAAGTIPGIA